MVKSAEPAHIQRLGIVIVMRVRLGIPAHFTRKANENARVDGPSNGKMSGSLFRILFAPFRARYQMSLAIGPVLQPTFRAGLVYSP
jgi:hypothetical protein